MTLLSWQNVDDGLVQITAPDRRPLALYCYSPKKNHPFFYDLRPLQHDGILTNHAPWDHRWHHGLWWSWKFINDILYWEDHPDFGGNRKGLGRSHVTSHSIENQGSLILLREELEWRENESGRIPLREKRLLSVGADTRCWWIDWNLNWFAETRVLFDVTPYPEKPWGGYAGLNYRPARAMVSNELILASGGRSSYGEIHGQDVQWLAYSGNVDGSGSDDPGHPARGGLAMIFHPENSWGSPSAYVFSAQQGDFGFAAAAPVFHGGIELACGQSLHLRYRTVIFGQAMESQDIDAFAESYWNM